MVKNLLNILEQLNSAKQIEVKGYTKANGEVTNYKIRFIDYGELRKKDHELLACVIDTGTEPLQKIADKFNVELKVVQDLYDIMVSNSWENLYGEKNKQAIAQSSIYTHWGKGSKMHNDTGEVYLWGICEGREVITPGPIKKPTKSRVNTLIKNAIHATCDYNLKGYINLKFDSIESLNIIIF